MTGVAPIRVKKIIQTLELLQNAALSDLVMKNTRGISSELKIAALVHAGSQWEEKSEADLKVLSKGVSNQTVDFMKKDVNEAVNFIERFPESSFRLQAKKNLMINWQNYDPVAAQNWLAGQPEAERVEIEKFVKSRR